MWHQDWKALISLGRTLTPWKQAGCLESQIICWEFEDQGNRTKSHFILAVFWAKVNPHSKSVVQTLVCVRIALIWVLPPQSVCVRICISNKCPDDADTAGLVLWEQTAVWEPLLSTIIENNSAVCIKPVSSSLLWVFFVDPASFGLVLSCDLTLTCNSIAFLQTSA